MNKYPQMKFLEKDFEELSKELTEKYRPMQLADLANIGIVLMTMKELCEEHEEYQEEMQDEIKDELKDAEKYYSKWLETHEENYKSMARDELKHADFFIKHNRMIVKDKSEQEKLQSYINWYNNIQAKL